MTLVFVLLLGLAIGVVFGFGMGASHKGMALTEHMRDLLSEAVGRVDEGESYFFTVEVGRSMNEGGGDDSEDGEDDEDPGPVIDREREQQFQWQ